MNAQPKILVCLDSDPQPSVFDAVVAVDAGVQQLLRHGSVTPEQVRDLVYGAMFTRGPDALKNTAVFIGGSDVAAGERLLQATTASFFGPMRVSVMLDSSGANTTAAAAVIAAGRHVDLQQATVAVLAGTGSVGTRVVQMLASEGAQVRLGSRSRDRAEAVASTIRARFSQAAVECVETRSDAGFREVLQGTQVVVACGPPGIELLPESLRQEFPLEVAIDLNAVPPLGIAGIETNDKGVRRGNTICYGAIGVGGTKMKIHRAAVAQLFEANDQVLDAQQIYELGKQLEAGHS